MGNLWITRTPVVAKVTRTGREIELDAGVVLDADGVEQQSSMLPDRISFTWVDGATIVLPYEVVEEVICGWFALCPNQAISLRSHPVLDFVPVCDRHTEANF